MHFENISIDALSIEIFSKCIIEKTILRGDGFFFFFFVVDLATVFRCLLEKTFKSSNVVDTLPER